MTDKQGGFMFKFCPKCASEKINFIDGKLFRCPDCGFVYYHNTAAATGCIITGLTQQILFLVRGKNPEKGKLDLPGGFVDPGEGAIEGLYREIQEEIGWTPTVPDGVPLAKVFTLFASFPNVYTFKNIDYNTCDLYFHINAPGLCERDLRLQPGEIDGVRFLKPEEINYSEFAFESTCRAVRAFLTPGL